MVNGFTHHHLQQSQRKDEHVAHALDYHQMTSHDDFEQTQFVHHALTSVNWEDVSIATHIGDLQFSSPFFISAMTGGSEKTKELNRQLAILAREVDLAIASGSLSVALRYPETLSSFSILREEHPNGIILANLGAHHSLENAKRAIDCLQANAIQIHLNRAQELIMPEGDRQFSNWWKNIESIVAGIEVPVWVKEVGFGMSKETIRQLHSIGVQVVDVAGKGGTNFARIENSRRSEISYDYLYNWGQSTLLSLLEAFSLEEHERPTIIASGGIKSPFDIVKSLALGASLVGASGTPLVLLNEHGLEKTIQIMKGWKEQLHTLFVLLGATSVDDLIKTDIIFPPHVAHWCDSRHIDWRAYASRWTSQ